MSTFWSDPGFIDIAELVTRRTGLLFAPNRCDSLERAVRTVMRDHQLVDLADFKLQLAAGAAPWDALVAQMTVGETYFFRDSAHFAFLRETVLPELIERRGAISRPRLWSAGCASGEEAYSLLMALAESNALEGAFVLGTDLNRVSLARARAGRYTKWSLRGLDQLLLGKYFERAGAEVVVPAALRAQVTFQELNLASGAYPSPATSTFAMDLILCRNVLIYLDSATIRAVSQRMFEALSPGGYLLTGPSDPLLSEAGFEILSVPAGVLYRRPVARYSQDEPARAPAVVAVAPPERDSQRVFEREPAGSHARQEERVSDEPAQTVNQLRERSKAEPAEMVEQACAQALLRYPLCAELHYLHALLLLDLGRRSPARDALRSAIYLEPSLAIAHFTLGSVLAGLHDGTGAARAYRNAELCARRRPSDEPVPCAAEISARGLASAAARELSLLRSQASSR